MTTAFEAVSSIGPGPLGEGGAAIEDADWPEASPAETGSCRLHPAASAAARKNHNTKRLIKIHVRLSGAPVKPNPDPTNVKPVEKEKLADTQ